MMATMCFCGGIIISKPDQDWPICSLSGDICICNGIEIEDGFADAIKVLEQKGYHILTYKIPRSDGWKTDYMALCFSLHTIPTSLPAGFRFSDWPVMGCMVMYRNFDTDTAAYKKQVEQSAEDLRQWADALPVFDYGIKL